MAGLDHNEWSFTNEHRGTGRLTATTPRAAKKVRHRQLLIDATLDVIAEHGVVGTSVTRIISHARLSRGMIHLHFKGKDPLLFAAARYMSESYYANLQAFVDAAGDSSPERLDAMISADLSEALLNRRSVNVWYAFRGEARSQNTFAQLSDTRDAALRCMFIEVYRELAAGFDDTEARARDAAHGTLALLEGMWADYFLHSDTFNRDTARRIVFRFISAQFPGHFDLSGAIRR